MRNAESSVNVFDATLLYLDEIFNTYNKVCIHLSGGRSSTVLLHLAATVAKVHGKKFTVLFIDREAQHTLTITHITKLKNKYNDLIETFYWIALPMTTHNEGTSCLPEWLSWEEGLEWWRMPPSDAIVDRNAFPFYRYAMSTEDFITEFSGWLASDQMLASLVGTLETPSHSQVPPLSREDASLSRAHHQGQASLAIPDNDFIYPLCGWQVTDLWLFNNLSKALYNPLYDLAYRSGKMIDAIKIPEPFESNVWQTTNLSSSMAHDRQAAINSPELPHFSGNTLTKPKGHTWCSYVKLLLNTMPSKTAEFYRQKIASYTDWYQSQGYPVNIPDEQHHCLMGKDVTSWENICSMILENDYRARALHLFPHDVNDAETSRKKYRKGRSRGNEAMFL